MWEKSQCMDLYCCYCYSYMRKYSTIAFWLESATWSDPEGVAVLKIETWCTPDDWFTRTTFCRLQANLILPVSVAPRFKMDIGLSTGWPASTRVPWQQVETSCEFHGPFETWNLARSFNDSKYFVARVVADVIFRSSIYLPIYLSIYLFTALHWTLAAFSVSQSIHSR
jgi:hypothetical protein